MKKRVLSLILAVCLTLGLLGAAAPAVWAEGEVTSGSCGDNAAWSFDEASGTLTISGTGAIRDFEWRESPWYHLGETIKTVKIAEGITHIGSYAFFACTSMTSVSIPNSVTSLGISAFEQCSSLTRVKLPDGITSIPVWCFGECVSLVSVEIPVSVTQIQHSAFYHCISLTDVKLPDGITKIDMAVFGYCASLSSINIPDTVTSIDLGAFTGSGLTSVSIPASVMDIARGALSECINLKRIDVHKDNPNYSSDAKGVLFNKNKTDLLQAPGGLEGAYSIPGTVKTIGGKAFSYCGKLVNVTIPEGVTAIYDEAFYRCAKLQRVDIPGSVTIIDSHAFSDCGNLTGIWVHQSNSSYSSDASGALLDKAGTVLFHVPGGLSGEYSVPDGVEIIDTQAFFGCHKLYDVILPDSLIELSYRAFFDCGGPYNLTIPASVTKLGQAVFERCDNLSVLKFEGEKPSLSPDAFAYWRTAATVYYPADIDSWEGIEREDYGGHITWIPYTSHDTHSYGDWVTAMEPTGTTEGAEKRLCECGDVQTRPIPKLSNPFTDIKETSFFYTPVLWAASEGITSGMTPTTFVPNGTCTRAQVVTFLWRAMGEPEPTSTRNPFTDVKQDRYYYKAVLWAVENGITEGMSATTFAPDGPCTRGQVVTFLWRAAGSPEPNTENPFIDLNASAFYHDAVLWAVENEITQGMTPTTFVPGGTCTRGQVVTFLYRDIVQ